jgi:predicted GNAT family N-acyltransferase
VVSSTVLCGLKDREIELELTPYQPGHGLYESYSRLQCRVYASYGVWRAKRASDACMQSCSHLVLARERGGAVLGGVRIHARRLGKLPIEAALPSSTRLRELLVELGDCVELSGTIVHQSARKSGLSALIVRAAVAAIPLVHGQSALGFGHHWVLPLYQRFGFVPDTRFSCQQYPDTRYHSRVAVMHDVRFLTTVEPEERAHIIDMRERMLQTALLALDEENAS